MFELFPDQWTPVTFARLVPRGRVTKVRVAGEAVAIFRDHEGRVAALLDRCPHRGVALSLGRVTESGTLECPFHGWEFDRTGACARVPFCPDAKRDQLAATHVPTRELGGMVWVFTGSDPAGTEPEVPDALVDDGWSWFHYQEEWRTHWTRAMENMLDFPHLPYVHGRSIGRGLRPKAKGQAKLVMSTEPTPFGMRIHSLVDGQARQGGLEWRRPNGMVLDLSFGGRRLKQHVYCVPVDATTTRMMLISARDFGLTWFLAPLYRVLDWSNTYVLREDRAVVESSQPAEVPPAREEKSVAIDAPTLVFRRWYYREIHSRTQRAHVLASALRREKSRADDAGDAQPSPPQLEEAS